MIAKILCTSLVLFIYFGSNVAHAQQASEAQTTAAQQPAATVDGARPGEALVPLTQVAIAFDAEGREALAGTLLTQDLAGSPDAPVRNTRIVVRNRSQLFYNYAQGWATFYDEGGVRCGEGLWKLEAFAPDERVEVDTPGLRLTCKPSTWRLVATTLLTRTSDVAKPREAVAPPPAEGSNEPPLITTRATPTSKRTWVPPLEINVNGKTIPVQLGNPLEVVVGKERVRIVVQPAP